MKKLVFLVCFIGFNLAFAQIPKPQKGTYVNDFANVLTPDQITELNQNIRSIENASGAQIAIVLVDKIPAAYEIDDFALLIGRKWHVGNQKKGIVYVVATQQHKQRLQVAANLQSIFTHDKCTTILDLMKGDLKAGDFNGGLQILVTKLSDELVVPQANAQLQDTQPNDAAAQPVNTASTQPDNDLSTTDIILGLLFFVGLPVLLIVLSIRRRRRIRDAQAFYNSQHPGTNPQGYDSGYPHHSGSGLGSFVAGAAVGAAAGYAANAFLNDLEAQNNPQYNQDLQQDNNADQNNNTDNGDSSSDWGNWGSSDSSSSDDSYDSGFSSDDSSDDSGSSSDF